MNIKWAPDMTTQIVNGSGNQVPTIDDWKRGRLLTAEGTLRPTGHKNPNLVADAFGDWREELFVRTIDSSAIRAYFSTEVTSHKLTTLVHDPQYRAEVARQNTTYNQPSYTSYYLASDMDFRDVPVPDAWTPGSVADLRSSLDGFVTAGDVAGPAAQQLTMTLIQAQRGVDSKDTAQVGRAMERFVKILNQKKNRYAITGHARDLLGRKAEIIHGMVG